MGLGLERPYSISPALIIEQGEEEGGLLVGCGIRESGLLEC